MQDGINITRLHENDIEQFIELIELLNEVFEETKTIASESRLKKLLNRSNFLALVAIKENKVIAGLTAYELEQYYTDQSELYIYDIAVKTTLHNRGIGKSLIDYLKNYSTKNGIETIFVDAHSEDEQAVKFYESTFGKGAKVDHFDFHIKTRNRKEECN